MKHSFLPFLACPECGSSFEIRTFRENAPVGILEIQDGALLCSDCHRFHIISHYIPRLLPDSAMRDPDFFRRYEIELAHIRKTHHDVGQPQSNTFAALQSATIRNFGYEWKMWHAFGWGDAVNMETTRKIFEYKVLMKRGELAGKLVLDAGCGNGRYTAVASEYGGTVIGIDLSDAVDVAWENLKADPKVHIVQGDLFQLPFRAQTFDFIFSNGVLMHTGDARKAFVNLTRHLKPDGGITAHLYHTGNPIYEAIDWMLRSITTRLPLSWAMLFSRVLAVLARALSKKALTILNGFIRIEPHPHYVFDWYTAPIATHHTYDEVYGWLNETGLHLVHDHHATVHPIARKFFPLLFLTVKAQKQPNQNPVVHSRD